MQKTEKFLEPRKHFCCLKAWQKLTPAEDSVHSHATKMTSYCKRCREELQDNQTDGEPFLKGCTKNLACLVEQNKAKRECDFRQASQVNNQRENSTPLTTRQLPSYRTAKYILNHSTLIWKVSIQQKWKFSNFKHLLGRKKRKSYLVLIWSLTRL